MNYSAVFDFYQEKEPEILENLHISPRKVYTGVKVLSETQSGLFNATSPLQHRKWRESFDSTLNLPTREDTLKINFPS